MFNQGPDPRPPTLTRNPLLRAEASPVCCLLPASPARPSSSSAGCSQAWGCRPHLLPPLLASPCPPPRWCRTTNSRLHSPPVPAPLAGLAPPTAGPSQPPEQASVESFLEELVVRRELADNYCHYCPGEARGRGLGPGGWGPGARLCAAAARPPRCPPSCRDGGGCPAPAQAVVPVLRASPALPNSVTPPRHTFPKPSATSPRRSQALLPHPPDLIKHSSQAALPPSH